MLRFIGLSVMMAICAVSARAQEDSLQRFHVLVPHLAHELVEATLQACEKDGFQVAVAVVDRFGVPQALLRNRFAGPHTPKTAIRKAYTAISFRSNTLDLIEPTQSGSPQSGARNIDHVLMLGGGLVIEAAGEMLGGLGISGAPSGEDDEACGQKGLDAIADKLPF